MSDLTIGTPGAAKAEKKYSRTQESHQYLRAKREGRWPLGMYVKERDFDNIHRMLIELGSEAPISLDEITAIVHDEDGGLVVCSAGTCGKALQPVASVAFRQISNVDEVFDIVPTLDPAIVAAFGRLAPFVATFEHQDGTVRPVINGSYVLLPGKDGKGWEPTPYCGALYWTDQVTGQVRDNVASHLTMAKRAVSDLPGSSYRSFSLDSAKLVGERRTANFEAKGREIQGRRDAARKNREEESNSIFADINRRSMDMERARNNKRGFQSGRGR